MRNIEDILAEARELSADQRRKLVDSLDEGLADEQASTSESSRLAALARWVARAGTGHSDLTDVARDKYKHLAEAYSSGK
jgi:hypothetical protein